MQFVISLTYSCPLGRSRRACQRGWSIFLFLSDCFLFCVFVIHNTDLLPVKRVFSVTLRLLWLVATTNYSSLRYQENIFVELWSLYRGQGGPRESRRAWVINQLEIFFLFQVKRNFVFFGGAIVPPMYLYSLIGEQVLLFMI